MAKGGDMPEDSPGKHTGSNNAQVVAAGVGSLGGTAVSVGQKTIVRVASDSEALRLASGTVYINTQGRIFVR